MSAPESTETTNHVRKPSQHNRQAEFLRGRNSRYGSGRRPVGPQGPPPATLCGAKATIYDIDLRTARSKAAQSHPEWLTCPECRAAIAAEASS